MTPENQTLQGQTEPEAGTPNPDSAAQGEKALMEQQIAAQENANVILAHGRDPITVDGPINIGTVTVEVPSEAQQRAGFYAENAEELLQQYPGIYKRALRVGKSAHAVETDPNRTQEIREQNQGQPPVEQVFEEAQQQLEGQEADTETGGEAHNGIQTL